MLLFTERHWRRLDDGWEATLVLQIGRRWIRLGAFYGQPPGSHFGLWRTRGGFTGALQGINLRVGKRYVGPCLTLLAHTKHRDARTTHDAGQEERPAALNGR